MFINYYSYPSVGAVLWRKVGSNGTKYGWLKYNMFFSKKTKYTTNFKCVPQKLEQLSS